VIFNRKIRYIIKKKSYTKNNNFIIHNFIILLLPLKLTDLVLSIDFLLFEILYFESFLSGLLSAHQSRLIYRTKVLTLIMLSLIHSVTLLLKPINISIHYIVLLSPK
jgi:hypothetical protein